jgi:hypothetical protein
MLNILCRYLVNTKIKLTFNTQQSILGYHLLYNYSVTYYIIKVKEFIMKCINHEVNGLMRNLSL